MSVIVCLWKFHRIYEGQKMNWLDLEVERPKSWQDHIAHAHVVKLALWEAFCSVSACTSFNETYHDYSLPHPYHTNDIFKVLGSLIYLKLKTCLFKKRSQIFPPWTFSNLQSDFMDWLFYRSILLIVFCVFYFSSFALLFWRRVLD